MNEKKENPEQFNILFDDLSEDLGQSDEVVESVASDAVEAEADLSSLFDEVDFGAEEEIKPEETPEASEEDAETVLGDERREAFPYDEEDASEEAEDEDDREERALAARRAERKRLQSGNRTKSGRSSKRENLRFGIFTVIIALLVAAAVIFILASRGIIFNTKPQPAETTAPTEEITSAPDDETDETGETEEVTSKEEETTEEETTDEELLDREAARVFEKYENIFVNTGAETLNVRKAPSADADKVGTLAQFGGGTILSKEGDWYQISSGGITGYVSAEFVVTGDEAKEAAIRHTTKYVAAKAEYGLNVRKTPSTEGALVGKVPDGAVMTYVGEENGFYQIRYNDRIEGYVSMDFSEYDYYLTGVLPVEN